MFFTNRTVIATFFVILVAASIYYSSVIKKPSTIEGDVLVLVLPDHIDQKPKLSGAWDSQKITLEWVDSCLNNQSGDSYACLQKVLKIAAKRAKYYDKPLVVITEKDQSSETIRLVNNQFNDDLAAIILLQPEINFEEYKAFNLPKKVVVINDLNDSVNEITNSNSLSSIIRDDGHWVWFTMLENENNRLITHPVLPYIVSFAYISRKNIPYYLELDAESRWQHPIFNNDEFLKRDEFIVERDVDADIKRILKAFYAYEPRLLKQWPLKTYKAFDLLKYRDSLPASKQGRYATFENRKGHKFYLDLEKYAFYEPEFVLSIDDENNLYRLTSFYITKQYYSWREGGPKANELYSQSMGAFIHFRKSLPFNMELPYLQYTSILMESIEFFNSNPYESLEGLTDQAFKVVTLNCIPCHKVNGVGGSAFHLDYLTGKSKPGFAKPLLSYSNDVLNNFFFNQTATAKLIGVNPNYVESEVAHEMIEWIQSRQ